MRQWRSYDPAAAVKVDDEPVSPSGERRLVDQNSERSVLNRNCPPYCPLRNGAAGYLVALPKIGEVAVEPIEADERMA